MGRLGMEILLLRSFERNLVIVAVFPDVLVQDVRHVACQGVKLEPTSPADTSRHNTTPSV
jgi:hypothetical protein